MGAELSFPCGACRGARGLLGSRRREPPKTPGTLLGNYLSGRIARGDHDTIAAADFYSKALAEDPSNEIILEQTFLLEAASAHWDRAIQLAKELVKIEPAHRIAHFLLGCEAFKQGNYKEADEHFAAARQGPIADLTSTLARAWVQEADGKPDEAFATLDSLERCRLGPVLSALSPRADRRRRRQA